jgi:hypothetical protein
MIEEEPNPFKAFEVTPKPDGTETLESPAHAIAGMLGYIYDEAGPEGVKQLLASGPITGEFAEKVILELEAAGLRPVINLILDAELPSELDECPHPVGEVIDGKYCPANRRAWFATKYRRAPNPQRRAFILDYMAEAGDRENDIAFVRGCRR